MAETKPHRTFIIIILLTLIIAAIFLIFVAVYANNVSKVKIPSKSESQFIFWVTILMIIIFVALIIWSLYYVFKPVVCEVAPSGIQPISIVPTTAGVSPTGVSSVPIVNVTPSPINSTAISAAQAQPLSVGGSATTGISKNNPVVTGSPSSLGSVSGTVGSGTGVAVGVPSSKTSNASTGLYGDVL